MKKLLAGLLIGGMLMGLVGCGAGSDAESPESDKASEASEKFDSEEENHIFGYASSDLSNPFHIKIRDTIQEIVDGKGDKLFVNDAAQDQQTQINAIEDMISSNIEVLLLEPVTSDGVKPALEACQEAGVKVVVLDSNVADAELTESFVASNNYQAGYADGEEMVKRYPNGAKLCLLENDLAESVVQRVNGLEDAIEGSKIEIVDRKSVYTMDVILSTTEDMIQAHPDMDIFWGLNGDISLVIYGCIESADLTDQIKVYSVDGSPDEKKSISDGKLYATAAQSPSSIAEKGMEITYDILDGKTVEKEYSIDTTLVTKENVEEIGIDSWN